ncbi:MAG: biotin--[acetyl-CoA-carboxylase] ligase [Ignavibacteriales bacterium]|nr:biotin--[acetyl-CoA-carboxylase] ligase [Ignavibacteriales bacterium]
MITPTNSNETLFDYKKFDMRLDTEWLGRSFSYLEETESTNTYAMKNSQTLPNGTVVFAEKQFKGKGRMDRVWYSTKNHNLTFSILLNNPEVIPSSLVALNFGTSLVTAQSIESIYQIPLNLKWPNDILAGKKKIAGILIETGIQGEQVNKVVIGIGMNVNQTTFQGDFMLEPTSVALEHGQQAEREKLLAELLNSFEEMLVTAEKDPEKIIKQWKEKCTIIGDRVSIIQNGKTIYGRFEDVDSNGNLLLDTGMKTLSIAFGDVSLHL